MDKHGVPPTKRLFLVTESHELDSTPNLFVHGGACGKDNLNRTFVQDVWINTEAYKSSTPMRYPRLKRRRDAGVKDGVFTPEGVKQRRNHIICYEREEGHDNNHD